MVVFYKKKVRQIVFTLKTFQKLPLLLRMKSKTLHKHFKGLRVLVLFEADISPLCPCCLCYEGVALLSASPASFDTRFPLCLVLSSSLFCWANSSYPAGLSLYVLSSRKSSQVTRCHQVVLLYLPWHLVPLHPFINVPHL